jgi:hypothetical protein
MPPPATPRGLALALTLGLVACAGPSTRAPSEPRAEPAEAGDGPASVTRAPVVAPTPSAERVAPNDAHHAASDERDAPKDAHHAASDERDAHHAASDEPEDAPAAPAPLAGTPAEAPPIVIRKGTRVLMFGDSMVTSGLGVYLEERVRAVGGTWSHISKPSSTTVSWADGRDLQELVARARPDVVIIALVSNELFVPNPRARIYAIREIIKRVGARPCLWVGPPSWRPDKGIVAVVRETASPCRFFDSAQLPLERQSDGIHPTLHGGRAWGEAVWQDAFATTSGP